MTNLVEISQLFDSKGIILLDSCGLDRLGPRERVEEDTEEKRAIYQEKSHFLRFILDNLDFFSFTPLVYSELEKAALNDFYFNSTLHLKKNKRAKKKFDLFRVIQSCDTRQKILVDRILKRRRVAQLNQKQREFYEEVFSKYFSLKEKHGASDADYEFLLYGLAFACDNVQTSLISNDLRGVKNIFAELMERRAFNRNLLGLYVRMSQRYLQQYGSSGVDDDLVRFSVE